jgi:hypothetical protein
MIFTKLRPVGMTIAALAVLLAALAAPLLAQPSTARAAALQKPHNQGLVEYAIILAFVRNSCTNTTSYQVVCSFKAQVSANADGSASGEARLELPDRSIYMTFQKAKVTRIDGRPVAELSGYATVTDERGRTRSISVRATVTHISTERLRWYIVEEAPVFTPRSYDFIAAGEFRLKQ